MTRTPAELRTELQEAFPADYPVAQLWKESSLEGLRVKAGFANWRWPEITLPALKGRYKGDLSACLSFMSPAGAGYYFPAFLLIALEDPIGADMIFESLMYEMAADLPHRSALGQAFAGFNTRQRTVVLDCLKCLAGRSEPEVSRLASKALSAWRA